MLFVKIYLGLLMIVIIFAIHNKAADLLKHGEDFSFPCLSRFNILCYMSSFVKFFYGV